MKQKLENVIFLIFFPNSEKQNKNLEAVKLRKTINSIDVSPTGDEHFSRKRKSSLIKLK